jgi:hypothetical protein
LASVAALGAEPALLERVQLRRLSAVIVFPLAAGILLGGALYASPGGLTVYILLPNVPVLLTAASAGLLGRVLCALIVRALRGRLRAATDPANLRIA